MSQEDYRKITVEKKGEVNFFTSQMIQDCMRKVITVNLHQTVKVTSFYLYTTCNIVLPALFVALWTFVLFCLFYSKKI